MAPVARKLATWTYMICYLIHWRITYGDTETPAVDTKPYQVHLSFGQTTKDIVVMAATHVNCSSSVFYGDDYYRVKTQVSGKTVFFGEAELNPRGLHYLHRFVIKDLKPGKRYYYRVGCNVTETDTKAFQVPENGTNWSPNFLVYGDLGLETRSIPALIQEVHSGNYTAALHLGDFAYDLETDGGEKGDKFMDMIEPIASELPYLTTPGNHEIAKDTFIHYRKRFSQPATEWPVPLNKMWYSVDIGPVHLISFSSEVYYTADDRYIAKQREWLAEDLKRANENRARTPWIVAISHRPLYCSSTFENGCNNKEFVVRDSLEKLFADNGVDLLLGGHVHSYERTWPAYKGEITAANYSNPSAPVTVISGGAGSGVTPIDPLNGTAGPWTAYRMKNPVFSYGVLSVTNSTHLRWQQKASSDQHVIDSFWLVQSDHGTPPAPHEASMWKAADYINRVKDVINSNKGLAIGLASAFAAFVIFGCVCIVVRCRRRRGVTRRWEVVDYDKSFYSDVKTEEDDFAFDDPEPSLTSNGTQPTSKLLAHSNA